MEAYVIGMDIGTGSIKTVAVALNGDVLLSYQQQYPTYHPQPGYSEQYPEEIWNAFVTSIQYIVNQLKQAPGAVCMSAAMHSIILVDEKATILYPMITWADTRSTAIAERLRHNDGYAIYEKTGTPLHAMAPLCKIIWIKENRPDLFRKTARYLSIKEYIWYKLFEEYKIDFSLASATALFNIETLQWHEPSLELAGISTTQLSAPVATNYTNDRLRTEVASELGLPSSTPFIIGASDGCLANVGSFALEQGVAALTIGTSGAVRIASPEPIISGAMTFNYRLDESQYICGGPVNNGGNAVDWLLRNFLKLKEIKPAAYQHLFEQISTVPAGSEGLLFLPYLYGERAPIWDGKSSGAFIGIRSQHQQAHFLRAALEGICYALNEVIHIVEGASQRIHQVNVSGGFIHSSAWMQLLTDITGKKIALVQTEDASAMGAAFFAMKAMGWKVNYQQTATAAMTYLQPNANNTATYQSLFSIYQQVYGSLQPIMHLLYDREKE